MQLNILNIEQNEFQVTIKKNFTIVITVIYYTFIANAY